MAKRILIHPRIKPAGQSFVELMLVTLILALMLAGVVELGYLLNSYLKVLDGAREGARFSNNSVAFDNTNGISYQTFYVNTAIEVMRVLFPIILNGNRGDDIVVSVFSVAGSSIRRWPDGYLNGWSLCNNHLDSALQSDLSLENWDSCSAQNSRFSTNEIIGRMDHSAPETGVLLVEVFYNYPQILKLPVFTIVVPDPILVFTYAIMPLSSAEPTPTPNP